MKYRIVLIVLFSLFTTVLHAQGGGDAQPLLREVTRKFSAVKDYQADATINTRISFLKVLPQKAKIYYRRPDQVKVKTQGIAILPKQNFDQMFSLLSKESSYFSFISGADVINGKPVKIANVVPASDTGDLVLARLWIDTEEDLVLKSQLTTKSNGTVLVDYKYSSQAAYALPDQVVFTIEVKKFKIPRAVSADLNSSSSNVPKGKEPKTGQIIISLSNYIVNKGIADSVFRQ